MASQYFPILGKAGNFKQNYDQNSKLKTSQDILDLAQGTIKITRLNIMAYLDPASNSGSKPQRFIVKKWKISTSDKLQTFKTIFGTS